MFKKINSVNLFRAKIRNLETMFGSAKLKHEKLINGGEPISG